VEGKTSLKRKALRRLVEEKKVAREGAGQKGDPFKYKCLFPCSPYSPGTREQETQKRHQTPINTGDILVPDIPGARADNEADRERETETEFLFGSSGNPEGRNPETVASQPESRSEHLCAVHGFHQDWRREGEVWLCVRCHPEFGPQPAAKKA
jgi:hypothetical protein